MAAEVAPRETLALVGALSLVSCVISGLTSFGDAIMFHTLWSAAAAAGAVGTDRPALARAVVYVAVMSLANLPLQLYFARPLMRQALPFGFVMALTGSAMVPVGASLLFGADIGGLKIFVGTFFLLFASARLTASVAPPPPPPPPPLLLLPPPLSAAFSATAAATAAAATGGSPALPGAEDDAGISIKSSGSGGSGSGGGGGSSSVKSSGVGLAPGPAASPVLVTLWPWPPSAVEMCGDPGSAAPAQPPAAGAAAPAAAPEEASAPQTKSPSQPKQQPGSYAGGGGGAPPQQGRGVYLVVQPLVPAVPVRRTALILLATGVLSGLLGGLLGVAGPPQMIAFAMLALEKDAIRAVSVSYAVFELPTRILMFTTAKGNVFSVSEYGGHYAVVLVCAWVGSLAGTWMRRFADTARIVQLLLVLVLMSSGILLGVLENRSAAGGFGAGVAAWAALLCAARLRPGLFAPLRRWEWASPREALVAAAAALAARAGAAGKGGRGQSGGGLARQDAAAEAAAATEWGVTGVGGVGDGLPR